MSKCKIVRGKCPESTECPCWHQIIVQTDLGKEEVRNDCILRMLPVFLTEVIAASNRPAAAIESMRNETYKGLALIAQGVGNMTDPQRIRHDG